MNALFNGSPTELTTAATDAAMGVASLWAIGVLRDLRTTRPWSRSVWIWVFRLLAAASMLGAMAHGLALAGAFVAVLWWPLYLSLGLSIALFLIGAIADAVDEADARRVLPWAVVIGIAFFAATQLLGGAFIIFVVYEAVAMLLALAAYLSLVVRRRLDGAGFVATGIALTIVAAIIQASSVAVDLGVPFDHNGMFHIVQIVAVLVLARGLRITLGDRVPAQVT